MAKVRGCAAAFVCGILLWVAILFLLFPVPERISSVQGKFDYNKAQHTFYAIAPCPLHCPVLHYRPSRYDI